MSKTTPKAQFRKVADHYEEYDGQVVEIVGELPEQNMYRVRFTDGLAGGFYGSVSGEELVMIQVVDTSGRQPGWKPAVEG